MIEALLPYVPEPLYKLLSIYSPMDILFCIAILLGIFLALATLRIGMLLVIYCYHTCHLQKIRFLHGVFAGEKYLRKKDYIDEFSEQGSLF